MKFPFFQSHRPATPPPPPSQPPPPAPAVQPQPTPIPVRRPEQSAPPVAPPTRPATSALRTAPPAGVDLPPHIKFKLRSLLAILPDNAFSCPRAELAQHVNLDEMIPLPTNLIIPQLAGARVTVPIASILDAIPSQILDSSRPTFAAATVTLPLQEIIPQLPLVFSPPA